MLDTFKNAFKLKTAYKVNGIIYSFKRIPLIKKIIPDNWYDDVNIKTLGNVFNIFREIGTLFLGKIVYLFLIFMLTSLFFEQQEGIYILHVLIFFTFMGAIHKNYLFEPSNDNYYGVILMHMDAKKYALSTYIYFLLRTFVGFLPLIIIGCLLLKIPLYVALLFPLFIVLSKINVMGLNIYYMEKSKKYVPLTDGIKALIVIIFLIILGTCLPLLNVYITNNVFLIIFFILFILSPFSIKKIFNYNEYLKIYKRSLKEVDSVDFSNTAVLRESTQKQIEYKITYDSNKDGYAYFHDLFVKRHRKVLTKAVKLQSLVLIGIFALAILLLLFVPESKEDINKIPLKYLPYFTFIMYYLNRGTVLTQSLFINCDHSMLTYRFFRRPNVILGLFKQRLKTLISLNLMPASIIAVALPIILFLTGGTDNYLNYIVLFVSIISMGIFFSVHYLVMYYLLQPYNANTEIKSGTYKIVQGLTYLVCYYMIQIEVPTLTYGLWAIIFSISYSVISLVLVYKLAPKTFRIRK